jgi:hypothetical protein
MNRAQRGCWIWIALWGSLSVQAEESNNQEWQPSTLSDAAIQRVHGALEGYQRCLNQETQKHLKDPEDSRKVTDLILGLCEDQLTAVKKTFDEEKVPAGASDRYIRGKRSRAAQQIVRVVMAEEASRSAKSH